MEHRGINNKKIIFIVSIVSVLSAVATVLLVFSTLFGIFAEVQDYESFSESRQELLKEYYEIDFPDDVDFVTFHYDHYRDINAVLVLKCSHKRFDEFMQSLITKADCSYSISSGTAGQYGTYESFELRYESSNLKTTVSYGTAEGAEYIELYSTRVFQKYKEFKTA